MGGREERAVFPVARIAEPRVELVFDSECYINYWLIAFKRIADGRVISFEMFEGQVLDRFAIAAVFREYRCYSFNGWTYDLPMITAALTGRFSNAALKSLSDHIIQRNLKPWDVEEEYNLVIPRDLDHVDLIEPAFGDGSLKLYGGRMHSKRLQDLPIDIDAVITAPQRDELKVYCINDLDTTIDLRNYLKPDLELRDRMSIEYGMDLRSKSDAQMAEAILRDKIGKLLGRRIYRPDNVPPGTTFRYVPPPFVRFTTPVLQATLAELLTVEFVTKPNGQPWAPAWGEEKDGVVKGAPIVQIGNGIYRMGYGGLHSSETCQAHYTDAEYVIEDDDVASYYPEIQRKCGYYPQHLGPAYLTVYSEQIDQRLAAKAAGKKAEAQSRKIVVNGAFGKTGSKWSALYAPNVMIHTTITGQLALLMLIEAFERCGITVISANTDGVISKCRRDMLPLKWHILDRWAEITGFTTETVRYKAVFSRDVNNYLALKFKTAFKGLSILEDQTAGFKGKGAFNDGADAMLAKNPAANICIDAVKAFLEHGTPIGHTIYGCTDVRKFLMVRRVNGGAMYRDGYLGKVVRWYFGQGSHDVIRYKLLRGQQTIGNTVARTEGCIPLMVLPDQFPSDLDHLWYVKEALSILKDVGYE